MNIYIPFTYIIGWSEHKKFYYGAKYAQGCQPSDLWESYFTSSDYVEEFRKENGEPNVIRIHKTFLDKDSCVSFEHQYLTKIDAKNNPMFLNKSNGAKTFGILDEESMEKRVQTYIKKYGTDSPNKLQEFKEKTKKTCLKKYGYEYALQVPEIKEKSKNTCLKLYGVESILQIPEIRKQSIKTLCETYGIDVSNPSQIPEIKEKKITTSLENWGYEHTLQVPELREKGKQTNLEKYGVDHPSKIIVTCPWCGKTGGKTGMTTHHFENCNKNPNKKTKDKILLVCEHCNFETDNKSIFTRFHSLNCRKNPNFINKEKQHKKHIFTITHTCPYCKKIGKGASMFRFHFENCKFKN